MATWVTFSNGSQACQTGVTERLMALRGQNTWPVKETKYVTGGWHYDYQNFTPEQTADYKALGEAYLLEEAQAYIEKAWPGQGITIAKREQLPYGGSPYFGSGSRGGFFCLHPKTCAGRGSCPRRYACSE